MPEPRVTGVGVRVFTRSHSRERFRESGHPTAPFFRLCFGSASDDQRPWDPFRVLFVLFPNEEAGCYFRSAPVNHPPTFRQRFRREWILSTNFPIFGHESAEID